MNDQEAMELFRAERAKRTSAPLVTKLAQPGREPECSECGGKIVFPSYPRRPTKKSAARKTSWVACGQCGHRWRTTTKDAFGPTRQVEVRG